MQLISEILCLLHEKQIVFLISYISNKKPICHIVQKEKKFLAILKIAQIHDYTSTMVKRKTPNSNYLSFVK